MLCPRCGTGVGDSVKLCASCQSQFEQEQALRSAEQEQTRKKGRSQEQLERGEHLGYAGFWIRYLALLIDTTICALIIGLMISVISLMMSSVNWTGPVAAVRLYVLEILSQHQNPAAGGLSLILSLLLPFLIFCLIALLVYIVVGWAYFAMLDSSDGSTPGKQLVGLRVCRPDGQVIGLGRASARHFLKLLSSFFYVGYFFNLFTPYRQTLHDLLTDCVVIKVRQVNPLLLWLYAFVFFSILLTLSYSTEYKQERNKVPFSEGRLLENHSNPGKFDFNFNPAEPLHFRRKR